MAPLKGSIACTRASSCVWFNCRLIFVSPGMMNSSITIFISPVGCAHLTSRTVYSLYLGSTDDFCSFVGSIIALYQPPPPPQCPAISPAPTRTPTSIDHLRRITCCSPRVVHYPVFKLVVRYYGRPHSLPLWLCTLREVWLYRRISFLVEATMVLPSASSP